MVCGARPVWRMQMKCYNYHTIQTGQLRSQCKSVCSSVCAHNISSKEMTKHEGTKFYACNNNRKNWLVINNYFTPNFIYIPFNSEQFSSLIHRKKQRETFLSSIQISFPIQIQKGTGKKESENIAWSISVHKLIEYIMHTNTIKYLAFHCDGT